ncbi:IclR family transcriptional regulator [Pantoea sp. 1.19]|uniref:IclR family transcriptional regulator n=1 Tax=Pantoea sp. 1.19 TaxID=1925589 RepID=UPI0009491E75|nr:IclR family transcriptional regulator [Pantoea sp. 1.19]
MSEQSGCRYRIPGLERGLQMLLLLGEQQREMTFSELHRLVDIPKATAYRVVQTLEYLGFLQRNPRTNTFSLGMKVLRLGFEYMASLDVAQVGQPVIEQLRDRSHCSSHLAIRDGQDLIYVARVSAAGSQINQVSIGTRLPLHCTSLGRMLLSGLCRGEFEQVYPEARLPGHSPGPVTDRESLWQMVQQDRARGYVIGESFYRHGISSIVYPIVERRGKVIAVVSIMVPQEHIPVRERSPLQLLVAEAAEKISGFLGHSARAG